MPRKSLTEHQKAFIQANYLTKSANQIVAEVGGTKQMVQNYRKREGLIIPPAVKTSFRINAMIGRTSFSPAEDEIIKANYLLLPVKALANKIKRSGTGVITRLRQLGLVIPDDIRARNIAAGRIKPGNVPFQKGKKQEEYMSAEAIERTKATRFKKGDIPRNAYAEDGLITVRHDHPERGSGYAYKYIRLSLGNWKPLHTHIWEQANGPVPKGYCLWFMDDDTMNCTLQNLELITRKENWVRNNGNINLSDEAVSRYMATQSRQLDKDLQQEILKHHPDLIELKRAELLLNRAIKQQENGK